MEKSRFSMLLLEPGEIYFEDYSCTMSETGILNEDEILHGRLKLCSKSLVFESKDILKPLLKLLFRDCKEISLVKPVLYQKNVIRIKVQQYVEMLENNILAPYKFIYIEKEFYYFFDFANAEECMRQMHQLQRASTLNAHEHNSMIATILHSRYMRMAFDPVMMDDFSEHILLELPVEKILPLVRHQGKLALTETTLYIQPFNNIENRSILKIKLEDIRRMYKRRFLQRQVGLEIYSIDTASMPHIYLIFQSTQERDITHDILENSPCMNLEKNLIEEMTLQWQNGIVSNYDYLIYLNCLADRSKNDLTQYPVFPWVLSDYTSSSLDLNNAQTFRDLSKPMGALNESRLKELVKRYNDMPDPKFLYGTHYSAPALVLFYLVRKYPHYMLCLQNGRFDHPDRMFNSIATVFKNCLKNMSDFKELIPEFYDIEGAGDFLVNIHNINFGDRHDGTRVADVDLPAWASSPEHCVKTLREALESEYVSRYLHLWIDLIFGNKQRGEEAVKANNVFYHICYEGSVDLDCVVDMNDRHALEVQIMEFGQVPKQLFKHPHVRRIPQLVERPLVSECKEIRKYSLECIDTIRLHKEDVTCAIIDENKVVSVGKDGTLKVYDRIQKKQIRSVVLCETPLSCCVVINENIVACGSWGNEIYLYDVQFGRVVESFRAHDDSVSCLLWIPQEKWLISGGWDCVVRVWGDVRAGAALRGLRHEYDHDGKVTALTYRRVSRSCVDIISGTCDGDVSVWRVGETRPQFRQRAHASPVLGAQFTLSDRMLSAAQDGHLVVTDLCTLHAIYHKRLPDPISCISWDGHNVLWLGSNGRLLQWDMHSATQTNQHDAHEGTIHSIFFHKTASDEQLLVSAGADKAVKLWRLLPTF